LTAKRVQSVSPVGLTLAKGGGQPNFASFEFLSYERPRHGHDGKDHD